METLMLFLPLCLGAVLIYRGIWSATLTETFRTSFFLFLKLSLFAILAGLGVCLVQGWFVNAG